MSAITPQLAQSYGNYVATCVRAGIGYFPFETWAQIIEDMMASEVAGTSAWTQIADEERVPVA